MLPSRPRISTLPSCIGAGFSSTPTVAPAGGSMARRTVRSAGGRPPRPPASRSGPRRRRSRRGRRIASAGWCDRRAACTPGRRSRRTRASRPPRSSVPRLDLRRGLHAGMLPTPVLMPVLRPVLAAPSAPGLSPDTAGQARGAREGAGRPERLLRLRAAGPGAADRIWKSGHDLADHVEQHVTDWKRCSASMTSMPWTSSRDLGGHPGGEILDGAPAASRSP